MQKYVVRKPSFATCIAVDVLSRIQLSWKYHTQHYELVAMILCHIGADVMLTPVSLQGPRGVHL